MVWWLLAKRENTASLFSIPTVKKGGLKIRNSLSLNDKPTSLATRLLCLLFVLHWQGNTYPDVTYRERSDRVRNTPLGKALNELNLPIIHYKVIQSGHDKYNKTKSVI